MVPFEPIKGRPVYCQDCLEKVQSGKMQPVAGRQEERKESQEFSYDLANIGIEFELKKPLTRKLQEIPSSIPVEKKGLSLSELKPFEKKEKIDRPEKPKQNNHRPKVDIEELREAIQESLKKAIAGEE